MTVSDQFKDELRQDKLDADNVAHALKLALTEAIELKITTWVVTPEEGGSDDIAPKSGYRMQTRINIVDGDIDNEVGSVFLGDGSYSELRDFHLSQVAEGREIIKNNLESLQRLFGILVGSLHQLSTKPSSIDGTSTNLRLPGRDSSSEETLG